MSPKALAAVLMLTAPPLAAQNNNPFEPNNTSSGMVTAADPQSVVAFFEEEGYPVRLSEDSWGDPLVEYRVNGDKMSLYFYGCDNNRDCRSLQFYAGYRTDDDVNLAMLNEWNTENRFARAYLFEGDASRIEMDIPTGRDGISHRDFADILDLWFESVTAFEEYIRW